MKRCFVMFIAFFLCLNHHVCASFYQTKDSVLCNSHKQVKAFLLNASNQTMRLWYYDNAYYLNLSLEAKQGYHFCLDKRSSIELSCIYNDTLTSRKKLKISESKKLNILVLPHVLGVDACNYYITKS